MHTVLISQCEKKAILKTASVLDAYAVRHGDRVWMSPMTREGLETVRAQLRAVATRQTAVSCYINNSKNAMKLAWIVGSTAPFGGHGAIAVAKKAGVPRPKVALPAGLRAASLLARLSGYTHDLGKWTVMFQLKLHGKGPMADAVRHEWVSLQVLMEQELSGAEIKTVFEAALSAPLHLMQELTGPTGPLGSGIATPSAALKFLVLSHHRLPTDDAPGSMRLSEATYVDKANERPAQAMTAAGRPSEVTQQQIDRLLPRVKALEGMGEDPVMWRAITTMARIALILADHSISGVDKTTDPMHGEQIRSHPGAAHANTRQLSNGQRVLNQELNWHLLNVGDEAGKFIHRMLDFHPPGISNEVIEGLKKRQTGRFNWQNVCSDALSAAQMNAKMPTLVFNVAGTGCGKTRMNVVAANALRQDEPLRIATCLNLRSLTLQTRDAYMEQLGMSKGDLACVIGSEISKRLHEGAKETSQGPLRDDQQWGVDEDGNPEEDLFEVAGDSDPAPEWLEGFLAKKPKMRPLIMSPAVVCTVDFLVKAGDPTQQGNYTLTNLRLMTSDLILDEIDSYDPKALVAVMRMVTAAAMWGRNVIASSATLSLPVAKGLWSAFQLGMQLRAGLHQDPAKGQFRHALIDDQCPPSIGQTDDEALFADWFKTSLGKMLGAMGHGTKRMAELVRMDMGEPDFKSPQKRQAIIHQAIATSSVQMHRRHRWQIVVDGEPHWVSFGLVRIANISTAVAVARHLADSIPGARVACYHSRLPRILRFMLERALDTILTRKPGHETSAESHPDVLKAVRRARSEGRDETPFFVVATPVAEIGRDHDFDWAIIEPSSAQSIVQTAGRVNRHRLLDVTEPNVAILQFNFLYARNGGKAACFQRPGLEGSDEAAKYKSHDLAKLVDWRVLKECGQIDARLRFLTEKHPLARFDDASSERVISAVSKRFMRSDAPHWMGADTYTQAPLRDSAPRQAWSQDESGRHYREEPDGKHRFSKSWCARPMTLGNNGKRHVNDWLVHDHDVYLAVAQDLGITALEAFWVDLRAPGDLSNSKLVHDPSFGYHNI